MRHTGRLFAILIFSIAFAGCSSQSADHVADAPKAVPAPAAVTTPPATPLTAQETALLDAAVKGDDKQVKILLDKGININASDSQGGTPLGHAAWFGHGTTVKLLIDRGANINAKKNDGTTPLMLALANKHPDVAEIIKKAGAKQ